MRRHHVQVSCPPGGEAEARRFYVDGLGLTEVAKPPALASRGGCWFRAEDDLGQVSAEIHVGVEDPFVAARRAHPALLVADDAALDELAARLRAQGHPVDERERTTFPGHLRFHTADPHGNRVEILSPA
jgi:catechol 2,3-dioxygenase-like lactoylglutathione lyase family enzyme